jgi:hypothetical protein
MAVMPTTTDLDWGAIVGFDVHILKGSSYDLKSDLFVNDGINWISANGPGLPPDLTKIEFTTDVAAPALKDNDISVDPASGKVDAKVTVAIGPSLRNFIVRCAAIHTNPAVPSPIERFVRIHVHTSLSSVWLSPTRLTIHMGADPAHLTVLAKFDDGVVGDISSWTNLAWSSSAPGNVDVDASSGALTAKTVSSVATIRVAVTGAAGASDSVDVDCKSAWATPQDVEWVRGKGAGSQDIVPNVLFLPDGFTATEKAEFQKLVRAVIELLGTSRVMVPYNFLIDSMNWWTTFVESPEAGISILPDAWTFSQNATTVGSLIPLPTKPAAGAATWTLPELIWAVGLPVPVDDPSGRPLAGRLLDWQYLFAGVTDAKVTGVYQSWLALTGYQPMNERNSAFGLRVGHRASLRRNEGLRDFGLDPRRTQPKQLDDFLKNLTFGGAVIGTTWAPGGRDRKYVFFVGRTNQVGGEQHDDEGYFGSTLRSDQIFAVAAPAAGRPGLDLVPVEIKESSEIVWTFGHEGGHAFGLSDEYGSGTGDHLPTTLDIAFAKAGNVESKRVVAPGGALDGTKITWLWPRIKHAGITIALPHDEGGGVFRAVLQPGHGKRFSKDDTVRLRLRDTVATPALSVPLTVTDVAVDDILFKRADGGVFDPTPWLAGSVLLSPTQRPGAAVDSLLPLVAPKVRDFITGGVALNGPPAAGHDGFEVNTPINIPAGLKIPPTKAFILGLYEGGGHYDLDIFHPAGLCKMRALSRPEVKHHVIRFCQVCRYLLVDKVDPTKHFELDAVYDKEYPEP